MASVRPNACVVCKRPAQFQCGACNIATYCGPKHQQDHWKEHAASCGEDTIGDPLDDPNLVALYAAIAQQDYEKLLQVLRTDVDVNHNNGMPLILATRIHTTQGPAFVKALLSKGAYVNLPDKNGVTPILSAMNGHPDIFDILVKAGANVYQVDKDGRNALHYAAYFRGTRESKDKATSWLEANAPTLKDLKDKFGDTSATLAHRPIGIDSNAIYRL